MALLIKKQQLKNEFKSMKENVLKKGNISSAWKQCHSLESIKHSQQTTQFLLILSNPIFFNDDSKYGFHHPDSGVHFGKLSRNSTLSVEYFDWNERQTLASLTMNSICFESNFKSLNYRSSEYRWPKCVVFAFWPFLVITMKLYHFVHVGLSVHPFVP